MYIYIYIQLYIYVILKENYIYIYIIVFTDKAAFPFFYHIIIIHKAVPLNKDNSFFIFSCWWRNASPLVPSPWHQNGPSGASGYNKANLYLFGSTERLQRDWLSAARYIPGSDRYAPSRSCVLWFLRGPCGRNALHVRRTSSGPLSARQKTTHVRRRDHGCLERLWSSGSTPVRSGPRAFGGEGEAPVVTTGGVRSGTGFFNARNGKINHPDECDDLQSSFSCAPSSYPRSIDLTTGGQERERSFNTVYASIQPEKLPPGGQ